MTDFSCNLALVIAELQQALKENTPAGAIQYFATQTAPDGWLKANGSAVSRTDYADLFSAIGITFGKGDGSTTFNLPDLRGEFIRGYDDGRGVDSGRVLGSKQKGTLSVYDAIFNDKTAKHLKTIDVFGPNPFDFSAGKQEVGFDEINLEDYTNTGVTIQSVADSGTDFLSSPTKYVGATRPRNVALLACIKY